MPADVPIPVVRGNAKYDVLAASLIAVVVRRAFAVRLAVVIALPNTRYGSRWRLFLFEFKHFDLGAPRKGKSRTGSSRR